MTASLTPRADAAMRRRFLNGVKRKTSVYSRALGRDRAHTAASMLLDSIGLQARLAFQYGATLDEVAAAAGLADPPALLGLDDYGLGEVEAELGAARARWTA